MNGFNISKIKLISCAVLVACSTLLSACQQKETKSISGLKQAEKTKVIEIEERKAASLVAYESWVVRWESRYGKYSGDVKPESEIFTTKADAERFAKELREAFKLIRHTSGTKVKVFQQSR